MEGIQIDLLTVVIAAFLNMMIGFLWYSKWLFGPFWQKHHPVKGDEWSWSALGYEAIVSLMIAYFLAFFEAHLAVTSVTDGMFVGFCLWLGFSATTQLSSVIWAKNPFPVFLLNSGCKLLSYLVMSGVIGA